MKELRAPVLTVGCDIRDPDSIAAAFDAAAETFGLPGVLVNNAAANFPVPAEDMSPNAWRTVVILARAPFAAKRLMRLRSELIAEIEALRKEYRGAFQSRSLPSQAT